MAFEDFERGVEAGLCSFFESIISESWDWETFNSSDLGASGEECFSERS